MIEATRIFERCKELYPIRPHSDPIAEKIFSLAWEHGHASGEQDILFYYCDFAELAQTAITETLQVKL